MQSTVCTRFIVINYYSRASAQYSKEEEHGKEPPVTDASLFLIPVPIRWKENLVLIGIEAAGEHWPHTDTSTSLKEMRCPTTTR